MSAHTCFTGTLLADCQASMHHTVECYETKQKKGDSPCATIRGWSNMKQIAFLYAFPSTSCNSAIRWMVILFRIGKKRNAFSLFCP